MTTPARRGTTTVSDRAVRRIAGRAVTEALAGGAARATGASAAVHGRRAEIALDVALPYPEPIAPAVRRVQTYVTARTGELTGLDIPTPRVGVTALTPPRPGPAAVSLEKAPPPAGDAGATTAPGRTPHRWWAQRRLPMAVLTLFAAVTCGALAADLVLVHTGHHAPAAWRTGTLHWLYGHGPGEPLVTVAAAGCALLGAWLILLAVTPGRRGLLTASSPAPGTDIAVDRTAVSALLRDTAAATDGISAVAVRVRRRRATLRAVLAFGDPGTARDHVTRSAERVLSECRLRRPLRLRVIVRPQPGWTPPAVPETVPQAPSPAPPLAKSLPAPAAVPAGDMPDTPEPTGAMAGGDH